jgi:hypothetical protein
MEAQQAPTTADSDDDYLDDVVVRAAVERLERELADYAAVGRVTSDRFLEDAIKTDYIEVEMCFSYGYELARIVQAAVETGAVRVTRIYADEGILQFAPAEN